ncbi:MAG: hypothetical protein Q9191_001539 [Dirinaria sp. TL-2023a]
MSGDTSQALAKRSQDVALMPPPPRPKRIKRPAKVLDEDDYTDALSHIIARDFFPGLVETESQQDYLNALESRDPEWIAAAGKRLTAIMTPRPNGRRLRGRRGTSMTPMTGLNGRAGETPSTWQGTTPGSVMSAATEGSAAKPKPAIDTNMSLGAFQSKYTSEDNESFYKLLDKQNVKRSERYAWMWADNKIPAARQIAYRKREAQRLADKASDTSGKELIKADALEDTRKATPDTWRSRPDNNLMFEPSSVEDTHQTVQQRAEETSRAPPKAVVYDNTRLAPSKISTPSSSSEENNPPPSPSLSAVQDALAGRPRPTASEATFNGASTPRINGYAFVDPEEPPQPCPWSSSNEQHPPFLGPGSSTPNPFQIKEGSRREALHHRMVDKVAKGKRAAELARTPTTTTTTTTTTVPRFASSPRIISKGGLTPAAQRLLGKVGGGAADKTKTPSNRSVWEGGNGRAKSGLRHTALMTPLLQKGDSTR